MKYQKKPTLNLKGNELIDEMLDRITVDEIVKFFNLEKNKSKKKEIKEIVLQKFIEDELSFHKFYDEFGDVVALSSNQLEELLGITKSQRIKFKDKFNIRCYQDFRAYGQQLSAPKYDYIHSHSITKEDIDNWILKSKEQAKLNRDNGMLKAKETKKKNKELKDEFYQNTWINMCEKWKDIDMELLYSYQLAFWTMWISRLAKSYQVKSYNAIKYKKDYNIKKEELYSLKNDAIKLLSKSNYSKIYFYQPENANKVKLHFCPLHFDKWKSCREFDYFDKFDFYDMNEAELNECPHCTTDVIEDYYSLYFLELKCEKDNYNFSFHIPYPIGIKFFGDKNSYEKVEHERNEDGLFSFGRAIYEDEKVIFTDKKILKYFNESMTNFKNYLNTKETML